MVLGKRFFRRLSDAELASWRPAEPQSPDEWSARCHNVGAANREMRRRAKRNGHPGVRDWLVLLHNKQAPIA
ncbi:hypothetical protein [Rhizorhabdus histidinilytica]|uniref:hypothetical protein n=1 Tax=Rhizorhabdus histidinilytica TaxID=439228 RepID=UPI00322090D4